MNDNLLTRLVVLGAGFAALYYANVWWIEHQVISAEIERYQIVKRSNDLRGICNAAESVAGQQLHFNREKDWILWKDIAAKDCLMFR